MLREGVGRRARRKRETKIGDIGLTQSLQSFARFPALVCFSQRRPIVVRHSLPRCKQRIVVLEELIVKHEILLDALAPPLVKVKVEVGALLKLVRRQLGLLVPLKPGQVLLVVAPRLLLQFARGEEQRLLIVRPALVKVKHEEERVELKLVDQRRRVVKHERGRRREAGRRAVGIARDVLLGTAWARDGETGGKGRDQCEFQINDGTNRQTGQEGE